MEYSEINYKDIKYRCVSCGKRLPLKNAIKRYKKFGNYCIICSAWAYNIAKTKIEIQTVLNQIATKPITETQNLLKNKNTLLDRLSSLQNSAPQYTYIPTRNIVLALHGLTDVL